MDIYQPSTPEQHRRALALLLGGRSPGPQTDQQIDALQSYAGSQRLSLQHVLVAREGHEWIAACLAIDSPGRLASLFLPPDLDTKWILTAAVHLGRRAVELTAGRRIQVLQAMVDPSSEVEAR